MPIAVDIEVRGLKEVQAKLVKVGNDLHGKPIMDAMRQGTLLVQRDARIAAPVDTGRLRASITPEVRTSFMDVLGVVGSNVEYAPFMEFGTKPHWPPPGALAVWAQRHGMVEFLVARAIATRGLKERKFLRGAFEKNESRIKDLLEKAVQEVARQ